MPITRKREHMQPCSWQDESTHAQDQEESTSHAHHPKKRTHNNPVFNQEESTHAQEDIEMTDSGRDQVDPSMVDGADGHQSPNSLAAKTPVVKAVRRMVVPLVKYNDPITFVMRSIDCDEVYRLVKTEW